jgi:uncharacterized protein (DUF1810 family)
MEFDLARFIKAQQDTYAKALQELSDGQKRSHWMWFIFPQIHGLGRSETARFYAISGRSEAEAYLKHPVLGARLEECTRAMLSHPRLSAREILGSPDDLKFHSCMTLFGIAAAQSGSSFETALHVFYGGEGDQATLAALKSNV